MRGVGARGGLQTLLQVLCCNLKGQSILQNSENPGRAVSILSPALLLPLRGPELQRRGGSLTTRVQLCAQLRVRMLQGCSLSHFSRRGPGGLRCCLVLHQLLSISFALH